MPSSCHHPAQLPHLLKHLPKLPAQAAVAQEGLRHQGMQEALMSLLSLREVLGTSWDILQ
jgi:hypothetical protein